MDIFYKYNNKCLLIRDVLTVQLCNRGYIKRFHVREIHTRMFTFDRLIETFIFK